jgi:hypothetical protein
VDPAWDPLGTLLKNKESSLTSKAVVWGSLSFSDLSLAMLWSNSKSILQESTSLVAFVLRDFQFYSKLRRIVPVPKNQFSTNLFLFYA